MGRIHGMVRFVIFFIVFVLCFSMPLSAQANTSTFPRVDLILWHQQGEAAIRQLGIQRIFDTWAMANSPGSTLTLVQKDNDDMVNHFLSLPSGMAPPDLLWTTADAVVPYVEKGLIQPVDSAVDINRFLPMLLDSISIAGKTYGIPLQADNILMLFYNKAFVQQAPQTFDALTTLATELQNSNRINTKFSAFAYNEWDPYWVFPIANVLGARPLSQDGKSPMLDSDAWVKAYQFVYDLKFKSQILPEICDYECADNGFRTGYTAMIINGDWALQGDQSYINVLGDQLGIAPLPALGSDPSQQRPLSPVAGQYILIPASTTGDKLTTAEAFLSFFATDKATVLSWTVPQHHLPALLSALNSDTITNDPILSQTSKILMSGMAYKAGPEMQCVLSALSLPFYYLMSTDSVRLSDMTKQGQKSALDCIANQQKP